MNPAADTSEELVISRIHEARRTGTPLRIAGSGTWLDAGRTCSAVDRLDIRGLAGIVAYEPGDLTLTARGGTTLVEIARVTEAEGQWLTLDPPGSPEGTLGATLATASAGPLASAFGTPRDHALGCAFVTGRGELVRAGGRVVKNVAGFDLTRLVTGAWGTLGAITEVTVRLRARPEVDRTLAVVVAAPSGLEVADTTWRWLRASEYTPLAAELVSPTLARRLGHPEAGLLVRIGGNATYVRAAETDLATMGGAAAAGTTVWSTLARADEGGALTLRFSVRPSRVGALWAHASSFAEGAGGFAHATPSRGVVRCILPAPTPDALEVVRQQLRALASDATIVAERLPTTLWTEIAPRVGQGGLAAAARKAFDPDRLLNPGILEVT